MTRWQPTNIPDRYDRARLAHLKPVRQAVEALGLPLLRLRKLNGILGALEVQIEDGGDNPEVNDLLVAALKVAVLHQVGERQAQPVLRALEAFTRAETERWRQAQAGTLPPIPLTPVEQLDEHMQEGYTLLEKGQQTAACDQWLAAWEMVKQMTTPAMRTTDAFDAAYPQPLQSVSDWTMDFMFELHNAGMRQAVYHKHRLRYAGEFLKLFPDEDEDRYLDFRRAEGEALWNLGRIAEAEAVYQALIQKLPDKGWAYIGWTDQYTLFHDRPKDYPRAEAILQQALARNKLEDREWVLDRLKGIYEKWSKPEQAAAVAARLDALRHGEQAPDATAKPAPAWVKKSKGKQPKKKNPRKRR
jgi:tetratricopeptide (TPR) repeat protein